jgi:3-hydroxyisobutyrate dehydrogenase-like beta-hydroxyacid dehydrogenase
VNPVGFIGLGRMGSAIACRMQRLGFPVLAYNRTPGRQSQLEQLGGTIADSPAAVADRAGLILTVVTGPEDVEQVLLGPAGVCSSGRTGLVVADLSTIDPHSSRAIAERLRRLGIEMLDAPMSGSLHDAERGTLGLLVGGDACVLEQCRLVLENVGRIYHFGPNGSGCSAKLALNLLLSAMTQSLAESFHLLEKLGLSRELFVSAVATSGLASPLFERAGARALAEDFQPRFSLRHLGKDLTLLQGLSRKAGVDLPLARLLTQIVTRRADELGDQDYSALIA